MENKIKKHHIYKIGENIINEKSDLTIIDCGYKDKMLKGKMYKLKAYKYKCNKCGFDCGEHYNTKTKEFKAEFWILEDGLKNGNGCACCSSSSAVIVKGINDIETVNPEMAKYILNKEDLYKYKQSTKDKVYIKCPECGYIRKMPLNNIYTRGFKCNHCSDGISYPEKITMRILDDLKLKYITQLNKSIFKWCKNYKYDFYLPDYNMIIETHGIQHYIQTNRKCARTLREEQENDKLKRELALTNGIEHYIEIDCRESDMKYIKNSILNSKLNELFDLSKVDWSKCDMLSNKSIMIEIINNYNKGMNVKELCNI